jgi:hypothetical protein
MLSTTTPKFRGIDDWTFSDPTEEDRIYASVSGRSPSSTISDYSRRSVGCGRWTIPRSCRISWSEESNFERVQGYRRLCVDEKITKRNFFRVAYDLFVIATHKSCVHFAAKNDCCILMYGEIGNLHDTWGTANRRKVRMPDLVACSNSNSGITTGPLGIRGCGSFRLVYPKTMKCIPRLLVWRMQYPLRWKPTEELLDRFFRKVCTTCITDRNSQE